MFNVLSGNLNIENVINPNFLKAMPLEFISSMLTMLLICLFSFVVYFKQKKLPLDSEPKGIVNVAEMIVEFADKQVSELMGCPKYFSNFGGYMISLCFYIFFGFIVGIIGIPNFINFGGSSTEYLLNDSTMYKSLPAPFTNLAFTLSIGLMTVILIELTKARTKKWKYFNQFIFNFPPLLPLVTNLVPMLSLGLRLFGNAFAGSCIMILLNQMFLSLANGFGLIAAPFIMPFLHAYFDIFSGLIQTIVFAMITMMNIAQQAPEEKLNEKIEETYDRKNAILRKVKLLEAEQ